MKTSSAIAPPPTFAESRRSVLTLAVALIPVAVLMACSPVVAPADAAALTQSPPPVAVQQLVEQPLEATRMLIGRTEAAQRVELRPRIAGQVEGVLFTEGEQVQVGQPLFRIDARLHDAALARAAAELQLARTRQALAASEAERARQLQRGQAIAAEEFERRVALHTQAQAHTAALEAQLQAATLERNFSVVRAPISGRIGRALVTPGNHVSVGAGQPPLATIVSVPLHVHVDVDAAEIAALRAASPVPGKWEARILDAGGQGVLARAPIDFVDNEIAAGTGTLRLRARIDRPTGLLPGQFVRVELAGGAAQPTLLLPEQAIGTDQGSRYVLVVAPDGKVEQRVVQLGARHGALRVATGGVSAGELIITSGLLRVRPGMQVAPQIAPAAGTAPATPT